MGRWGSRVLALIPWACLALIVALRAWDPVALQLLRDLAFDTYQRTKPRVQNPDDTLVRIIDIDNESLAKHGQWPWPRTLIAQMVDRLTAAKVGVIGFDVVFAEADRLSPSRLVKTWPKTPETEQLLARAEALPDNDKILAEAMARSRVVTGFFIADDGTRAPAFKAGYGIAGADPLRAVFGGRSAIPSLPELEASALGNGALNWYPER